MIIIFLHCLNLHLEYKKNEIFVFCKYCSKKGDGNQGGGGGEERKHREQEEGKTEIEGKDIEREGGETRDLRM